MICFISHNAKDKPKAELLGTFLLSKSVNVFYDKWDIRAGESLTDKISDAIDNCDVFIILISAHSNRSIWVKEELKIALHRRFKDPNFKIIPLVLEPESTVPAFLRDYLYIPWFDDDFVVFENLLNSIFGTSSKPLFVPEDFGHILTFLECANKMIFHGYRGEKSTFHEYNKYKVMLPFTNLNRKLSYDGKLSYIKNDVFSIHRGELIDGREEIITYEPIRKLSVGDIIEVNEEMELLNNFDNKIDYWFRDNEIPPHELGKLSFVFDFTDSTPIKSMKVFLRETPRPIEDVVKPQFIGKQIFWTKPLTSFAQKFTFRFEWED